MKELSNNIGHSYYYKEEIFKYLEKVLQTSITIDKYNNAITSLINDLLIINKEDKYYLKDMYESEITIVKRFITLNNKKNIKNDLIDKTIESIENNLNLKYNEDQIKAIKESYEKSLLIITGGPGTGKTTIVKGIIELYKEINKLSYNELQEKIALVAPTGRAAKRISEATNLPASTIHRFLKWQKETNKFQVNEYNKSNIEFIIIDEASMIDTYLIANLIKGLKSKCKIIIIGDDKQLPSVGPGQVLSDLISSEKLNTIELKKIYRQKKDSNILQLAYDVRNGYLDKNIFNIDEDLTFIECYNEKVIDNIKEISNTYKDI